MYDIRFTALVAGLPLAVVKLIVRVLLISGILAYFLVAAGLLATRYWLLPNIDQWRGQIEQAISNAANVDVRFDRIQAEWFGLNANLHITNLRILDGDGVAQLGVPHTEAVLSWRSIFRLEPVFRYIGVDELVMVARRAPEGELYVAGFEIDTAASSEGNAWDSPGVRWLLRQGRINVANTRVAWVDQKRQAVPLVLSDIDLTLNNGLFGHELSLRASLPDQWGGSLELVASVDALENPVARLLTREPSGYFYVSVSELYPQAMKPWVDLPALDGSFAGRIWVDLMAGKLTNFTVNLAGRDAVLQRPGQSDDWIRMGRFQSRASGPIATLGAQFQWPDMVDTSRMPRRLSSSLTIEDGYIASPASGMADLRIDQLSADYVFSQPSANSVRLDFQELAIANADGLITARGAWVLDDRAGGGMLDFQGTLARFMLPNLHRYLPDDIGEDAHQWLQVAFKSGVVPRASFEIKGSVDAFPYTSGADDGIFKVEGTIQDWTLDYAPVAADELPWPLLADMSGTLNMLNDRISVQINAGSLSLPKNQRITLSQLSAELVDLEQNPVVTINSMTSADAEVYLALFSDTALKDVAPEFVRGFNGAGSWTMPLALRVPLEDMTETTFKGTLGFNGGSVSYDGSPPLTGIQGAAILTQTGFQSELLAATLLGGTLQVQGGINHELDTLQVKGNIDWADLAKYTNTTILNQWLKGGFAYDLTLKVSDDDQFELTVESGLNGTQIVLPAPLGKAAGQNANTRFAWQGDFSGAKPDRITLSIANRLSMNATRSVADKPSSFFSNANIAIGAAQPMTGRGLTFAVSLPTIDLDNWMPLIDTVAQEMNKPGDGVPLMPGLSAGRIQTNQLILFGNQLDAFVATLSVSGGKQRELNIDSQQTKGTVSWAISQGKLQDGFHARFDRLTIGGPSDEKPADGRGSDELASLPEPGSLSNLPMLDLEIAELTLYGGRLGRFSLLGANSADNREWQIRRLQIKNPHAEINASGRCRFDQMPGISLDLDMTIENLGELTKFMGHGEPVRNGRGDVRASIDWAGFPWRFDYAGITGTVNLELAEGVFDGVSSSSARVLEILSLQSFGRLLDRDLNRDETFQQGFPWSSIKGTFDIKEGVVGTQDLAVNSPVATISLTGESSLVDKTWDMRAVVRPNLDLSGAAVATGFIVNPLVGLGALVGQYLLRNPVESALSQRYVVTGTWENPVITSGGNQNNAPAPPPVTTN